jgi:hypothetical protein
MLKIRVPNVRAFPRAVGFRRISARREFKVPPSLGGFRLGKAASAFAMLLRRDKSA